MTMKRGNATKRHRLEKSFTVREELILKLKSTINKAKQKDKNTLTINAMRNILCIISL